MLPLDILDHHRNCSAWTFALGDEAHRRSEGKLCEPDSVDTHGGGERLVVVAAAAASHDRTAQVEEMKLHFVVVAAAASTLASNSTLVQ